MLSSREPGLFFKMLWKWEWTHSPRLPMLPPPMNFLNLWQRQCSLNPPRAHRGLRWAGLTWQIHFSSLTFPCLCIPSTAVLSWGQFCPPPWGIWQCPETFLIITAVGAGEGGCNWHVVGRGQRCCCRDATMHRTGPNTKELPSPKCQLCQGWENILQHTYKVLAFWL